MSSVLYRQCKKSIYNNIRTHRNTALNHSIQTIFKIYQNIPSLITIVTKGTIDSLIRPFCLHFLNELKSLYEIVIFTSGTKEYADRILNSLDKRGDIFKYRLYRQHTTLDGYISVKDLSLLGRDLNKTIIIDNLKDNFKVQPDNGLFIKTWISDILDEEMRQLEKILKDIVKYRVKDVRNVIRSIHNEINNDKMYKDIDISKLINTKS